ncbi:MAG: tetratricopeptide repeat protein [Myxococcota bacterium]
MDELIAQLTPRRPWWPWLTASAVSLAAITWAFVASAQKIEVEVPVDPCLEPGQELAIRWSPEAWTPRAPESAAAVSVSPWSIVDDNAARYSESWTQTVEGLCRAAQRGESVGAAHTQALACLGQGAREFNTTAEVVRSRESAEGLEGAFGNLHPPQLCVAPQGRPVFGSASAELIEELEAVRRLQLEGDDERALTRARALRGRAEKASDVVVAAQVSFSIGKLEILFNDPEAAVKHLEESALLAERLGDDLLAAEAYAELIDVVTLMWGELDDAVRYGKMGRVKLQRAGAVYSEVAGQYHSAMSNLEFRLRNLEAAAGHAQRAYELLSVRQGHQSLAALIARSNHAAALCDLKRYDDAIASYLHNLELRHRTYGPKHSSTVHDELRLGRVYLKSGRLEPAMAQYRKVEELAVPQVGDIRFSRIAAFSLGRQCEIVVRKGDYASALPYCERAGAALRELPHDRQQRGARQSMRRYYGFALMGVGRYEEALVQLGREHELLLEMSPGNEANLAYNTSARCRVLLELGRATECRSELDHAASWFEKSGRMQSLQNLRAMTKQPQRK